MIELYQVDAFTNEPFRGNPAAVCILLDSKDDKWMQSVAEEMNLSETAFVYPLNGGYSLRWFTPAAEVDLCGHATLASAHILWERGYLDPKMQVKFHTKSGLLTASNREGSIELDFPSEPEQPSDCPREIIAGLGIQAKYVGRNRLDYLIEVESEDIVRNLKPDWALLSQVATRGIIVTSQSDSEGIDFVSRAFFPRLGVNEDSVTGSAHCCLGPYWQKKLHKSEFVAYQASKRGGIVQVKVSGNRILLSGQAVTVMSSKIHF